MNINRKSLTRLMSTWYTATSIIRMMMHTVKYCGKNKMNTFLWRHERGSIDSYCVVSFTLNNNWQALSRTTGLSTTYTSVTFWFCSLKHTSSLYLIWKWRKIILIIIIIRFQMKKNETIVSSFIAITRRYESTHTSGVIEVKKHETIMTMANDWAIDRFWLIVCDAFFRGSVISWKKKKMKILIRR